MSKPEITFANDRMRVRFAEFGPDAYEVFLRCKKLPESVVEFDPDAEAYTIESPARFAEMLGVDRPPSPYEALPMSPFLYDDQRHIVELALDAKRFAVWSGCGNGKTLIGLEVARHVFHRTGGRVLIVTLNEIAEQWLGEAAAFYEHTLPVCRLASRAGMREWMLSGGPGVAVVNYEKWNPGKLEDQVVNEARHLAGIILDENRLKTGGGKQKWALIKSCRGIEYKLSLTATPAPNDTIEFASQASFLEKMRTDADIIWTFFRRDEKTHRWTVKPHARAAFFEFMASWSIYVNDPKRYGWRLDLPDVPRPTYHVVEVRPTAEQLEWRQKLATDATGQMNLFGGDDTNAIQRAKLSQIAKGFRYRKGSDKKHRTVERIPSNKPGVVADIIRREAAGGAQVLVWTVFDAETQIVAESLGKMPRVDVLTGKTEEDERLAILRRFRRGETRVLISRANMLGFGMNFQCCSAMVFNGWTDSFETLYQAVRRAVRHGQGESVRVYFPVVAELEGDTLTNIRRKEAEFERAIAEMEDNYLRTMRKGK